MLDVRQARKIGEERLEPSRARLGEPLAIVQTTELDAGWLFSWTTARIASGDHSRLIAGNVPVAVFDDGTVRSLRVQGLDAVTGARSSVHLL